MNQGPLLVVPACEKGRGGGHLVRSLVLVRSLRSQNREAYFFLPQHSTDIPIPRADIDDSWIISDVQSLKSHAWDCIVLDRFKTPASEFAQWSALAPLIGIDEGGMCRDQFDFLIDLLPGPPELSAPNLLSPSLLPLPKNRRPGFNLNYNPGQELDTSARVVKILVSFGAEDPAGLTLPVALALVLPGKAAITALFGPLNQIGATEQSQQTLRSAGIQVLQQCEDLREHLAEYDLVITHFGLTAFECLYAKVPVILVSPSAYHEKLARHAGFISAGIGPTGTARLPKLLYKKPAGTHASSIINQEFFASLGTQAENLGISYGLDVQDTPPQSLGDLVGAYHLHVPGSCPLCGLDDACTHPVRARFENRTYRRCPRCGMVYMLRTSRPPIEYEQDYFFDFYKKQYGKTYLEDFPNLIQNSKNRLKWIKTLLAQSKQEKETAASKRSVLDIGCAYGPFLVAAQEEQLLPIGIDPAADAVRYVQEELKISAYQGFFPDTPLPGVLEDECFDVISLWYVIEHFERPDVVLKEIHRLLKPGGVLAFSSPSFSGISSRVSSKRFLEKSPQDHWTIWEPRCTGTMLKRFGFSLRKIVISGHHPERFPGIGRFLTRKHRIVYAFFFWISRVFRLGDTFEVYAVKEPR